MKAEYLATIGDKAAAIEVGTVPRILPGKVSWVGSRGLRGVMAVAPI
jgi:hypothetical protein